MVFKKIKLGKFQNKNQVRRSSLITTLLDWNLAILEIAVITNCLNVEGSNLGKYWNQYAL